MPRIRSPWAAARAWMLRTARSTPARASSRSTTAWTSSASRSRTRSTRLSAVYRSYATRGGLGVLLRNLDPFGPQVAGRRVDGVLQLARLGLRLRRRRARRTRRPAVRRARGLARPPSPGLGAAGRAAGCSCAFASLTACSSSARRSVALTPPPDRRRRRGRGRASPSASGARLGLAEDAAVAFGALFGFGGQVRHQVGVRVRLGRVRHAAFLRSRPAAGRRNFVGGEPPAATLAAPPAPDPVVGRPAVDHVGSGRVAPEQFIDRIYRSGGR